MAAKGQRLFKAPDLPPEHADGEERCLGCGKRHQRTGPNGSPNCAICAQASIGVPGVDSTGLGSPTWQAHLIAMGRDPVTGAVVKISFWL